MGITFVLDKGADYFALHWSVTCVLSVVVPILFFLVLSKAVICDSGYYSLTYTILHRA